MRALLPVCLLLLWVSQCPRVQSSTLLAEPVVHSQVSAPSSFDNDRITQGNGVVLDDSFAYITTLRGKLLVVPLHHDERVTEWTVLYDPSRDDSAGGVLRTCVGSPLLYDDHVVYTLVEASSTSIDSEIVMVPTTYDATRDAPTVIQRIPLSGIVRGTPVMNPEGHLFVSHDILPTNGGGQMMGQLSIWDLRSTTGSTGSRGRQVISLPDDTIPINARVLSPPSRTRVTLDDDTVVDWIVLGEAVDNGSSNQGDVYAVRFNPFTEQALWHRLSENIGGSTAHAPAVSDTGTTLVLGTNRYFLRAWVQDASIASLLQQASVSSNVDIGATIDARISRQNGPVETRPVLLGETLVLVPDLESNLLAYDLSGSDGNGAAWTIDTGSSHAAAPIVIPDPDKEQWIVYHVTEAGILRQVLVDFDSPRTPTLAYAANCQGLLDPTVLSLDAMVTTTQSQCGGTSDPNSDPASVLADFAVSPNGAYVVYVTETGSVTTLQVGDGQTRAPSSQPSSLPTTRPSLEPSAVPSRSPSATPTTGSPTITAMPSNPPVATLPPTVAPSRPPTAPVSSPSSSLVPTSAPSTSPDSSSSASGLGADSGSTSSSSDSLGLLAVALGVAAAVLFCAVLGAFYMVRRKRVGEKQEQERAHKRELEVKKNWLSNKKIYEEEMRLEEEETLNDLNAQPEALAAAQVLSSSSSSKKSQRKNRRRASRRRNGGNVTLGSISESEHEEMDGSFDNGSDAEESGFEISLEAMEQGYTQGETYCESSFVQSTPPVSPPSTSMTTTTNDEVPAVQFLPSLPQQAESSPAPVANSAPPPAAAPDNHSRWFAEVMSLRAALFSSNKKDESSTPSFDRKTKASTPSFDRTTETSTPSVHRTTETNTPSFDRQTQTSTPSFDRRSETSGIDESKIVPESGISAILESPGSNATPPSADMPDDEEEPGIIRSNSRGNARKNNPPASQMATPPASPSMEKFYYTRTPSGRYVASPSVNTAASPSDLLSVDSSLYLEGSTVAHTISPGGGNSVKSQKSDKIQQKRFVPLSPPGGGSVMSIKSDDGSQKSASGPGAHYLASRGVRRQPAPMLTRRSYSPADEMMERSSSPTKSITSTESRGRDLMYEEADSTNSPRGATVHVGSAPAYQSRAGLFSRRSRQMDRLLPQYESDATASASETEPDDKEPEYRRNPPSRLAMPNISGRRDRVQREPSAESLDRRSSSDSPDRHSVASENSAKNTTSSTSVWNSFLSELSKAENQFFNPSLPASEEPQSRRQSRSTTSPDECPDSPDPPPPPISHRERAYSPEPPPPPPFHGDDPVPRRPSSRDRRSGSSSRRLVV